jgi:CheY-like chemotaxis protein
MAFPNASAPPLRSAERVSPPLRAAGPDLLLIDPSTEAAAWAPALRTQYQVSTTPTADTARQFLRRSMPSIIVTELDLAGGDGVDICRQAKALPIPPSVLVTTTRTERVPDALAAGCDGVLLKPFAPNLLYARIGRLLRARSESLRTKARHQQLKAQHLGERTQLLLSGSNRVWPHAHCPYCAHAGVTSFEFASHRRAWYACLQCKQVWLAKRQE